MKRRDEGEGERRWGGEGSVLSGEEERRKYLKRRGGEGERKGGAGKGRGKVVIRGKRVGAERSEGER